MKRWTEYLPLAGLQPDPRNPKLHDEALLAASLGRFGYVELIAIDERTGRLISGHGRRERLLEDIAVGRPAPRGIRVDEDGVWWVPVLRGWSSDDDDQAWAALVGLNEIGPRGGWDDAKLIEALAFLAALDGGLVGVGFTREELDDMIGAAAPPPSLDDLADRYGTPDPASLWPVMRFVVDADLAERFEKLVDDVDRNDEVACFERLVTLAEAAEECVA